MAPYKEKLDIYRYELPDLERRIHNRIIVTKELLSEMTSPVKSTVQEHIYREYLKRIEELTAQANTDLLDIKTKYDNKNNTKEIKDFKTSATEHPPSTQTRAHGWTPSKL